MKPVLAVIAAATMALGPSVQPVVARPAEGAVRSLSIVPTSGRAELVIGLDGAVEVQDFTLRSPDRIVLDLAGASLGMPVRGYDRVPRAGITDVRYSVFRRGTVRVVLYLDGPHQYQLSRADGQVRVSVTSPSGPSFASWHVGAGAARDVAERPAADRGAIDKAVADNVETARADAASDVEAARPPMRTAVQQQAQTPQQSQEPRITVVFPGSDIRDVIAAFAAFSGRTIIAGKDVTASRVDVEIRDKPWDVALKAILASQGLAATEDANGIIVVDTQERIAARSQTEPLATHIVRLNYQRATAVGDQLRQRLLQCIPAERSASAPISSSQAAGQPPVPGAPPAQPTVAGGAAPGNTGTSGIDASSCRGRGSISSDEVTNSISITAPASSLDDLVAFAESLDLRQPQVNIKAKIVLVNRTDLDALGIKYDLGTRQQFFNTVIQRADSNGTPLTANDPPRVLLGGNTVSAIANASGNVPGAALRLIYSTALGNFDFSTFLDALQEVSLLDVQAEPSVTTVNNHTAELISGVQVPFVPLVSSGGSGTTLTGPVTVERVQTGVTLRVTPSVTNNRQIMMNVEVINADVNFTTNGTTIDNNSNKTQLLVADGQTVVIGGLTQTSVRVTKSGIPILVDLPLIGRLFGYTSRQEQRRDLLILITPHITDEGQAPSDAVRR